MLSLGIRYFQNFSYDYLSQFVGKTIAIPAFLKFWKSKTLKV